MIFIETATSLMSLSLLVVLPEMGLIEKRVAMANEVSHPLVGHLGHVLWKLSGYQRTRRRFSGRDMSFGSW